MLKVDRNLARVIIPKRFCKEIHDFKIEEDDRQLRSIGNRLVKTSKRAAEHLVKGSAVCRYPEPRKSHDIAGRAGNMLRQKPRGIDTRLWSRLAKRICALDGYSTL